MKKIYYIFLFLLSFQLSFSKDNFSAKPILIDYKGITGKDSTIIAYGNYGSYLISFDSDKTWETKKIFEKGDIIKMFYENDRIVAFNRDGLVAVSYDNALSWEIIKDIGYRETYKYNNRTLIHCAQIVNYNDGYVYRNMDTILVFSKNFDIIKSLSIKQPQYFVFEHTDNKIKTIAKDDNYFYFSIHDFKVIKTDFQFNILDTINIRKALNLENENVFFRGNINYQNNYFYFKISNDYYKIDKEFKNPIKIVTNLSNGERSLNYNLDFFYNSNPYFSIYYDDTYYYLNENNEMIYTIFDYKRKAFFYDQASTKINTNTYNYQIYQKDSIIYFVKQDNKIRKINMSSTNYPLDYEDISLNIDSQVKDFEINKINNQSDKLLVLDKEGDQFNCPMSFTHINSNLFHIDMNNTNIQDGFANESLIQYYKYFDDFIYEEKQNKISVITQDQPLSITQLYFSEDGGQNFKRKDLHGSILLRYYDKNILYLHYKDSIKYYIILSATRNNGGMTRCFWLDENYNYIKEIRFNKDVFHFNEMQDSLNYTVLSFNTNLSGYQIKSTSNKGETWEIYKELPSLYYLLDSKELLINDIKIWVYSYIDENTNKYHLEMFDIKTKRIYTIFEKVLTEDEYWDIDYIGFDAAKEKFYLSFYNTLMVSSNIYDENIKWETFNYPNNGKVNKKFQVFDKTIFARYEDDKNEDNVYWINGIEMVGDPTSIENSENQIEEVNYLYTLPPYPNPTRSEVTAKFYWDSSIDINNSEIAVFDLNGNKVSGKENLSLDKLNEWSGNIKWNCTGVPSGTYLIKIQHGNNTKSVKVVVN